MTMLTFLIIASHTKKNVSTLALRGRDYTLVYRRRQTKRQ